MKEKKDGENERRTEKMNNLFHKTFGSRSSVVEAWTRRKRTEMDYYFQPISPRPSLPPPSLWFSFFFFTLVLPRLFLLKFTIINILTARILPLTYWPTDHPLKNGLGAMLACFNAVLPPNRSGEWRRLPSCIFFGDSARVSVTLIFVKPEIIPWLVGDYKLGSGRKNREPRTKNRKARRRVRDERFTTQHARGRYRDRYKGS